MEATKELVAKARTTGTIVCVLLALTAVLDLYAYALGPGDPLSASQSYSVLSLVQSLLLIVTGTFYLIWTYRSVKVVRQLSSRFPYQGGFAVASYFIPLYNIYKPYRITKETFEVSAPEAEPLSVGFKLLLLIWWIGWIVSGIFEYLVSQSYDPTGVLIYTVTSIVSALSLIVLVRKLPDLQSRRIDELAPALPADDGQYPRPSPATY